jgi:hypothetical protein
MATENLHSSRSHHPFSAPRGQKEMKKAEFAKMLEDLGATKLGNIFVFLRASRKKSQ